MQQSWVRDKITYVQPFHFLPGSPLFRKLLPSLLQIKEAGTFVFPLTKNQVRKWDCPILIFYRVNWRIAFESNTISMQISLVFYALFWLPYLFKNNLKVDIRIEDLNEFSPILHDKKKMFYKNTMMINTNTREMYVRFINSKFA